MNDVISMPLSSFIAYILSAYRTGLEDSMEKEPEIGPEKETLQ